MLAGNASFGKTSALYIRVAVTEPALLISGGCSISTVDLTADISVNIAAYLRWLLDQQ